MLNLKIRPPAAVVGSLAAPPLAVARWDRTFRVFLWLYVPFAWLALLILPAAPPASSLDGSWRAVLHYAAAHHWQSGVDVVFTYGPLGYLQCAETYTGGTYVACLVYQLLYKAFFVGLVTSLALRLPRRAAVVFLLLNTLLPLLDEDAIYLLTVGYGGVVLAGAERADRRWSAPVLAFLAAAALMKTVFLVYAVFMLGCVSIGLIAVRRPRDGWTALGGFVGCYLVLYVWLGTQRLADLSASLRNSWEIVVGLSGAMATFPPNPEAWFIAAALLGVAGWQLSRAAFAAGPAERGERWARGSMGLVCTAGLFIAWRQGFTRADPNHQITFFIHAACTAAAAALYFPSVAAADRQARFCVLEVLLAALVIFQFQNQPIGGHPSLTQRLATNCRWLFTPDKEHARLEALAAQAAEHDALPRSRALIAGASVDLFGCAQTILLRNGFNYRPAPVFQPYCAYTARLMELNAAFYRSEHAPEFVFFDPYVIDNRFPNLENAPVLAWLLRHYQPVLFERGLLLLRRKFASPTAGDDAGQPLAAGELRPGEKLVLPPGDGPVWCELDWQPNLTGKLAGLLFQPPLCRLDVFAPGEASPVACRLIPAMASAGFLLTPVVDSAQDFARALAGRAEGQRVAAIRVDPGPAPSLMQATIRYRLRRLPPFPPLKDGVTVPTTEPAGALSADPR